MKIQPRPFCLLLKTKFGICNFETSIPLTYLWFINLKYSFNLSVPHYGKTFIMVLYLYRVSGPPSGSNGYPLPRSCPALPHLLPGSSPTAPSLSFSPSPPRLSLAQPSQNPRLLLLAVVASCCGFEAASRFERFAFRDPVQQPWVDVSAACCRGGV